VKNKIYKKISVLIIMLLSVSSLCAGGGSGNDFNPSEFILGHVGDAYEWHITTVGSTHISIPLPIIVYSGEKGLNVFMSSHFHHGEYNGFYISQEESNNGKVVEKNAQGEEVRPWDFSLTKNAASLIISSTLLILIVLYVARWYRKDNMKAPTGFRGTIEMLILFIYDDLIKPSVGKDYRKYSPYLLTVFFFIFFNNLLGLIPLFPGGANVTGNIAITLFLAVCTFLITNFSGTKEYWREIFWPDVPTWLKVPVPLMPIVEIVGILTKPFALMMRLFANMLAGHMIVLVLTGLIFIFTAIMGVAVGAGVAVISMAFAVFMIMIDVLVCFIQAYVFTMLSAIFIGMARIEPHHHKHELNI